MMKNAVRWKQRFENFEHAFLLLKQAFEKDPAEMSDLEKEGVIQRFLSIPSSLRGRH